MPSKLGMHYICCMRRNTVKPDIGQYDDMRGSMRKEGTQTFAYDDGVIPSVLYVPRHMSGPGLSESWNNTMNGPGEGWSWRRMIRWCLSWLCGEDP